MKRLIEEKFPGVTYELEFMTSGVYNEHLTAQFAGGTPPDIMLMNPPVGHAFADRGDTLDLAPLMARSRFRWDDYIAVGDTYKTRKGRIMGVPFTGTAGALFYNKTAWDQAGLPKAPIDWTWDDLLEWGKRVARDDNRDSTPDRFMIQQYSERNGVVLWGAYVHANGGRVISPDGKKSAIAEPAAVEALEFLADLALKHNVAPRRDQYAAHGVTGFGALFNQNKALISPTDSGSFAGFNQRAEQNGFTWDLAYFPKAKRTGKTAVITGSLAYAISAKVQQPDTAWEVLRFQMGPEVQTLLGPPPNGTKAYNEHVLRDAVPQPLWDGSNEFLAAIYAELLKGFDGTAAMRTACEAAAAAGDQELRRQGRV
jgi:multiple sugar transport system substrate-binding protein